MERVKPRQADDLLALSGAWPYTESDLDALARCVAASPRYVVFRKGPDDSLSDSQIDKLVLRDAPARHGADVVVGTSSSGRFYAELWRPNGTSGMIVDREDTLEDLLAAVRAILGDEWDRVERIVMRDARVQFDATALFATGKPVTIVGAGGGGGGIVSGGSGIGGVSFPGGDGGGDGGGS